jgi:hypothetical protein
MGYESYRGIFQPFLAAFPDFRWELSNLVAGGDGVAIEVIETGTFKAAYEYKPGVVIEPTGRSYACQRLRVRHVRSRAGANCEVLQGPARVR